MSYRFFSQVPLLVFCLGCAESGAPGGGSLANGGASGADQGVSGSSPSNTDGGGDAGFAGDTSTMKGGGIPGCPTSQCDAFKTQGACESADVRCIWQEVRVIPDGASCSEGFTEERCLDMEGDSGSGGGWGAPLECGDGAIGLVARTERGTVVTRGSFCGVFPKCFEYCDGETNPPECACACDVAQWSP